MLEIPEQRHSKTLLLFVCFTSSLEQWQLLVFVHKHWTCTYRRNEHAVWLQHVWEGVNVTNEWMQHWWPSQWETAMSFEPLLCIYLYRFVHRATLLYLDIISVNFLLQEKTQCQLVPRITQSSGQWGEKIRSQILYIFLLLGRCCFTYCMMTTITNKQVLITQNIYRMRQYVLAICKILQGTKLAQYLSSHFKTGYFFAVCFFLYTIHSVGIY